MTFSLDRRYFSSDKRSSGIFGDILRKEEEQAKEERAAAEKEKAKKAEPEPEPIVMEEPLVMEEPIVISGDSEPSQAGDKSQPPAGGVDPDLWEVLCELSADPHAASDNLAENSVFSLEDCMDTPNYRLGTFGVDDKTRRALGRWIANNGGPEFEEEEEEELKEEEVAGGAGGESEAASKEEAKEKLKAEEPVPPFDWQAAMRKAPEVASAAWTDIKLSLSELFTIDKDESVLKQKVHNAVTMNKGADGSEDEVIYEGGSAIMVVKDGESAWERIRVRMTEAPLFQELLRRAREARKSDVGKEASKAKDKLSDKVEDVREVWETSQNPWVYRVSEMWDSLTHETDTALVIKELRRLEPNFSLEVWKENMKEVMVPNLLSAWLRGDTVVLREWCKSDVMEKLSADIAIRKKERVLIDPNVLSVDHAELIIDPSMAEDRAALIGLFVAAQQIHCVRNHEGEITEGGEDHIKLYKYLLVFQREYIPEEGEIRWMLADFAPAGDEDQMI